MLAGVIRGASYAVDCWGGGLIKTEGYEPASASSIRRVGASLSGSTRAGSLAARPTARVTRSLTPPVSAPKDSVARSATSLSSGLVSYLLCFGSIRWWHAPLACGLTGGTLVPLSKLLY